MTSESCNCHQNKLIIICGLSFAGKSTLGNAILDLVNGFKFDIDDIKFELYGPTIQDHELIWTQWNSIYGESYKRIEQHLRMGKNVVHDSGNFTRWDRAQARNIAKKLGIDVVTIFVDTPVTVAKQRLLENRETQARLNVIDEDWQEVVDTMEPPTQEEHPLVFRYGDSISGWIKQNLHVLQ